MRVCVNSCYACGIAMPMILDFRFIISAVSLRYFCGCCVFLVFGSLVYRSTQFGIALIAVSHVHN